jgi:hypothetical protein
MWSAFVKDVRTLALLRDPDFLGQLEAIKALGSLGTTNEKMAA